MPVVFGTYEVGVGFSDGSTHAFGLELWIKTLTAIGGNPIDVSTTYVDQDGNPAETTTVTTSIPASTPTGTLIKVALNSGDYAVRDVTNITIVGGTAGDKFEERSLADGYYGRVFTMQKAAYDSHVMPPLTGNVFNRVLLSFIRLVPNYYPAPNPQIMPLTFKRATYDSHVMPPLTGNVFNPQIMPLTFKRAVYDSHVMPPFTGIEHTAINFKFLLKYSLYGNWLAGYLRQPGGVLITTGFRVILKNMETATGVVWGKCYSSGIYQILLEQQNYNKSFLLVGSSLLELYDQFGSLSIDGNVNQNESKDLYFLPSSNDAHTLGFKKRLWP